MLAHKRVREIRLVSRRVIGELLSWERIRMLDVSASTLTEEVCSLLRHGPSTDDAARLFFTFAKVFDKSGIYDQDTNSQLKYDTIGMMREWLNNDFDPRQPMPQDAIGHFYGAFTTLRLRMPEAFHDVVTQKLLAEPDYILPVNACRILGYYAGTADQILPEVFHKTCRALTQSHQTVATDDRVKMMLRAAMLDAIHGSALTLEDTISPQELFHRVAAPNVMALGRADQRLYRNAQKWFDGQVGDFQNGQFNSSNNAQCSIDFLKKAGFVHFEECHRSAEGAANENHETLGHKNTTFVVEANQQQIELHFFAAPSYASRMGEPRLSFPAGGALFHLLNLERANPDRVILNIPLRLSRHFGAARLSEVIMKAAEARKGAHGMNEEGNVMPIRAFSFYE